MEGHVAVFVASVCVPKMRVRIALMEEGIAWLRSKQPTQRRGGWSNKQQRQPLQHNLCSRKAQAPMVRLKSQRPWPLQSMMIAVFAEQPNNASKQGLQRLLILPRHGGVQQSIQGQLQMRKASALSRRRQGNRMGSKQSEHLLGVTLWWMRCRDRNALLHALFGNLRLLNVNVSSWRTKSAWLLAQECEIRHFHPKGAFFSS